MKLLLIGIDGGDIDIINSMDMPFLKKLIAENKKIRLEEDLWTRGWSKILSGAQGEESGAFYAKPILNTDKYVFTQSFRSTNYSNHKEINPLWEAINNLGYSIGLLNFPTTAPIPKELNGFMITGAGGGVSQKGIGSAPDIACFPPAAKATLDANEYIFDIRFRASGLKRLTELINSLINMHTKRVDNFIKLSRIYRVNVGGIAFMSITRIQYLAMYDITEMMKNKNYDGYAKPLILKLYRSLDKNLERLYNEISPENFIICSDHSAAPRKGTINLNAFLKKNGLIKLDSPFLIFSKRVYNKFVERKYSSFIKKSSEAFTGRYISGLYINDRKRFGGPVLENEIDFHTNRIIKLFNSDSEAQRNYLTARLFRAKNKSSNYYDLLPDVWIDRPDELFFEASGNFVDINREYTSIGEDLSMIRRDQYTGIKGRYPIFVYSNNLSSFIPKKFKNDLTVVYDTMINYLSS